MAKTPSRSTTLWWCVMFICLGVAVLLLDGLFTLRYGAPDVISDELNGAAVACVAAGFVFAWKRLGATEAIAWRKP